VILIDANLLIYAHVNTFPQHANARVWLDDRLGGTVSVGLPWPSLLVEEWLDCSPVWIPQPTERHREVLKILLRDQGLRANLIPDAHLAALAIEHGLMLNSTDGDFGRFPGLRWENPLAGQDATG